MRYFTKLKNLSPLKYLGNAKFHVFTIRIVSPNQTIMHTFLLHLNKTKTCKSINASKLPAPYPTFQTKGKKKEQRWGKKKEDRRKLKETKNYGTHRFVTSHLNEWLILEQLGLFCLWRNHLPSHCFNCNDPSLIKFRLKLLNRSREYCLDAFLQSVPAFIIAANSS